MENQPSTSSHLQPQPSPPSSSSNQPILLPPRFQDAPIEHLLALISDMMDRIIVHNDQIPLHPEGLTRFHSSSPPGISVHDYLARIVRFANVERSCLLITLHYIDQICDRLPRFTITSLTVHRFIIASVTVSSKALCDVFCTNSRYAQVGGITVGELNLLERGFLDVIDWRLFCTGELLQEYYENLVRTHSRGTFKLDVPVAAPETHVSSVGSEADEDVGDEEEAESTAHPDTSVCAESSTTMGDNPSDSGLEIDVDEDSEAEDVDYHDDVDPTNPSFATTSARVEELISPRTAAKRRDRSVEDAERLRAKGRRRIDKDDAG